MPRGGRRSRSGPPPKPTALRAITGDTRRQAKAPGDHEPKPARERPPRPGHLRETAVVAWDDLCELLDGMGVLTVADGYALEMLVEAYADWRDARAMIELHGMTQPKWMIDPEGEVCVAGIVARPEVGMADKAWRRFHAMLCEFGLTPAARTRVKVKPAEQEDPFERRLTARSGGLRA